MLLFQYLPFLQDPAVSIRDVPNSEVHDRGAQHGFYPTVSKEALAEPEGSHREGPGLSLLKLFLRHGIIMELGPLLLLIPIFDRN